MGRSAHLRYADGGGSRHLLDVYRPRSGAKGAPVLLQIHGGAWVVGSKNVQGRPLLLRMAAAGWVCVAINYRLSPRVRFPDHLIDCKLALKWIREHIAEYGGDPSRVVVSGGSAGGHLAAMVALTQNDPAYQPGFEAADTSVLACVPVYGPFDLEAVLAKTNPRFAKWFGRGVFGDVKKASPITHVKQGLPPMLVIQGTQDNLVPSPLAHAFVDAVRAAGNPTVLHLEDRRSGARLRRLPLDSQRSGDRRDLLFPAGRHRAEGRRLMARPYGLGPTPSAPIPHHPTPTPKTE